MNFTNYAVVVVLIASAARASESTNASTNATTLGAVSNKDADNANSQKGATGNDTESNANASSLSSTVQNDDGVYVKNSPKTGGGVYLSAASTDSNAPGSLGADASSTSIESNATGNEVNNGSNISGKEVKNDSSTPVNGIPGPEKNGATDAPSRVNREPASSSTASASQRKADLATAQQELQDAEKALKNAPVTEIKAAKMTYDNALKKYQDLEKLNAAAPDTERKGATGAPGTGDNNKGGNIGSVATGETVWYKSNLAIGSAIILVTLLVIGGVIYAFTSGNSDKTDVCYTIFVLLCAPGFVPAVDATDLNPINPADSKGGSVTLKG